MEREAVMEKEREDTMLVGALSEVVRSYIRFISSSYKIGDCYKSRAGISHYGFVPADTMSISYTLLRLYHRMESEKGKHKFLDIGCGIGNIVLLAHEIGFDAYGLEYDEKIYDIAKGIVGKDHIFLGDMTSFRRYGEYDVLYYYQPMVNLDAMDKFGKRLVRVVKPGAYVIPRIGDWAISKSKEFKSVKLFPGKNNGPIYRKKGETK